MKTKALIVLCGFNLFFNSTVLAKNTLPDVNYNREVIYNKFIPHPSPLQTREVSVSPVYKSPFQRLLGQSETKLPMELFDRQSYHVHILKSANKAKIINFTSKGLRFYRGIYVLKNAQIIGYAFMEALPLFKEKNPPVLSEIQQIPLSQNMFSQYVKTPIYGRLEFRQKEHEDFIEQYVLYYSPKTTYSPGNGAELLLDAFYPKSEQKSLSKTLGLAIARRVRQYNLYFSELIENKILPPDELDIEEGKEIDSDMDEE